MSNPISTPIIASKYRVQKRLGGGSFGDIYLGEYIPSSEKVAIKFEKHSARCPQLRHEYKVYRELQHCPGFGRVHYFGTHENYNVMVMELLGYSLEDLFNKCGRTFSLKTVLQLADQVLERVETMHNRHLIHRDIKPANFVIGYTSTHTIHCIDFGLSKRYRHPRTLQHIAYREGRSLTGTPRYASINNHLGVEQSRRDDLESIGYVLIYFLRGILPWQGLKAKTASRKYRMIMEKKQAVTVMELCQGCPVQFQDYLNYCRSLTFDGKPDMSYLRGLFRELYVSQGYAAQGVEWDWDKFIPSGNTGLGTYPDDINVQLRIARQQQIQQQQMQQQQANAQSQNAPIVTQESSAFNNTNNNVNSNPTGGVNTNPILSSSGEDQTKNQRYNNVTTNVTGEIYNNSNTQNNVNNTTTTDNNFGNNMDSRMVIEENQNNKMSSSSHQDKAYASGSGGPVLGQSNSTNVGNSGNAGDATGGNDNTNVRTSHKRHLSLSPPQRDPGVGGTHGQDGQISNAWGGDGYKPPVGSRPKTAHGTTRMATRSHTASSSGNFGTTGLGNSGTSGNYENFRPSTSGVTTGHGHSLSLSQTHSSGGSNVIRPGTVGANVYNSQIPLSSNKSSSGNSNTHSHSHSKSNSKSNNPNHVVASTRGMMRYRRTRSSTAENGGGGGSSTGGGSNGGGGSHHHDGGSNGYGNTSHSRSSGPGSQRGKEKVRHSSASMTRSNTVYAQTASSANKTNGSGNVKQETFYNVVWRKAKSFARPTSASNMSGRRPSNTGNSNVSTGMNSQGSGNKIPRGSQGSMGSHNGSATGSHGVTKKVRGSSNGSRNSNTGSNNGSNNGNGSSSGSKHRVVTAPG